MPRLPLRRLLFAFCILHSSFVSAAPPVPGTLRIDVVPPAGGPYTSQAIAPVNNKVLGYTTADGWKMVAGGGGGGSGDALTTDPLSQFAATTSAQLASVLTDETGTGAFFRAGGNAGAFTATSLNGLTVTTSTGTLTVGALKTLTVSNTLTLAGTDGSTLNIGTGGTLGTMAFQAANNVTITGGNISGANLSGSFNGTIESDAGFDDPSATRTALGLGSLAVQNSDAATITGLSSVPANTDIFILGDSRSAVGAGGLTAGQEWPAKLVTKSAFSGKVANLYNLAAGNAVISTMATAYTTGAYPHRPSVSGHHAIIIVNIGGNDTAIGTSAATSWTALQSLCNTALTDGFNEIWICTDTLRLTAGWTKAINDEWFTLNDSIRASTYTRVIDLAALLPDPRDTTYFNADVLHITDTGATRIAEYINWLAQVPKTLPPASAGGFNARYLRANNATVLSHLRIGDTALDSASLNVATWGTYGTIAMSPDEAGVNDASGITWFPRQSPGTGSRSFSMFANVDAYGQLTLKQSSTDTGLPNTTRLAVLSTGAISIPGELTVGTVNGTALGTGAYATISNYLTTATAATTYQPLDTDLTTWSGITPGTGVGTFLATPSSANLRTALTDETGTGAAVFATSPTLVTPLLGTPTSGTLTNCTGLPVSTGLSGLGTGIATALAINTGSAGAPVLFNGAGGTPSSLTLTNATGLPVAGGGTGQTSFTDGQLLIGNSTGNTLTKATLTAGTNITITNGNGSITIASSGGGSGGTKTIARFFPRDNEPPASNPATLFTRNSHSMLQFDTTTQETAIFRSIVPEASSLTSGVTVVVTWAATSATSGTAGWDVAFERIASAGIDLDSDSFGTAQTITATTVSGTSGITLQTSVNFSQAQLPSSLAAGDMYRVRIRRDVANDNAAGDIELYGVEIKLQ